MGPYCNTAAGACVACLVRCEESRVRRAAAGSWEHYACVQLPASDEAAGSQQPASLSPPATTAQPAQVSAHCSNPTPYCNPATKACSPCGDDANCSGYPVGTKCDGAGRCAGSPCSNVKNCEDCTYRQLGTTTKIYCGRCQPGYAVATRGASAGRACCESLWMHVLACATVLLTNMDCAVAAPAPEVLQQRQRQQ